MLTQDPSAEKKQFRLKPPNSKPSKPVSKPQKNVLKQPHPTNRPPRDDPVQNHEHPSATHLPNLPQKRTTPQVHCQRNLRSQDRDQRLRIVRRLEMGDPVCHRCRDNYPQRLELAKVNLPPRRMNMCLLSGRGRVLTWL
jgi:hypothetical protein